MKGEAKSKDILLCVKAMSMTDGRLNLLDENNDTIEINVQKVSEIPMKNCEKSRIRRKIMMDNNSESPVVQVCGR